MTMNFEQLQTAWADCNRKITAQKALSEKLIVSMAREKSHSTLAAMRRQNLGMAALFLLYTVFFIACIAGNAFDYPHAVYYIPLVVQGATCFIFVLLLLRLCRNIGSIQLSREDLASGLRKVIRVNDRHLALSHRIWWCYFIAGAVFPLTFLPKSMSHRGMAEAIFYTAIPVVIAGLLVLLAKKWGLFKDRKNELLKNNLHELEAHLTELEKL